MGYPSRDWAIKWLRGSIMSYLRGNIDKKVVLGRMRKCYEAYSVSLNDIKALIESLVLDPSLNLATPEMRRRILNELMTEFENRVLHHSNPE